VDIVGNSQPVVVGGGGATSGDVAIEPVLRVLDLGRSGLVVIISVDVEVGDVVAQIGHVLLAAGCSTAAGKRGTHVGGEEAQNIAESHLILDHLLLALSGGNGGKIQVSPGMGSNLMSLGVGALNDGAELRDLVDCALADVGTSDEERGLCIVGSEDIENM